MPDYSTHVALCRKINTAAEVLHVAFEKLNDEPASRTEQDALRDAHNALRGLMDEYACLLRPSLRT